MEEYRKGDWMNAEESPCHKCSNKGMCMIAAGCRDWRIWFLHKAGDEDKVRQLQEEAKKEGGASV